MCLKAQHLDFLGIARSFCPFFAHMQDLKTSPPSPPEDKGSKHISHEATQKQAFPEIPVVLPHNDPWIRLGSITLRD